MTEDIKEIEQPLYVGNLWVSKSGKKLHIWGSYAPVTILDGAGDLYLYRHGIIAAAIINGIQYINKNIKIHKYIAEFFGEEYAANVHRRIKEGTIRYAKFVQKDKEDKHEKLHNIGERIFGSTVI